MSSARAELIAVSGKDIDQLAAVIKRLTDEGKLIETLTDFNKRQLSDLWDSALQRCTSAVLDDAEDGDMEEKNKVLDCVIVLASSTVAGLQHTKEVTGAGDNELEVPQSLQETVIILHGLLLSFTNTSDQLSDKMSDLFEEWWHRDLPCKLEILGNTLVYLLTRSTEAKATQKYVNRLWKVHTMLSHVDLTSDASARLIKLVLQSFHHHQFITTATGLKFLVYILSLTPELTKKIHVSVRLNLLATPKSWHSKYGEIYFRAWQKSTEDLRQTIEQDCIQDLMFRAIHSQRGGQTSPAVILFRVLTYLHKKKTVQGVDSMLTDLYGPILWRCLNVANSDVRVNAATIMFDVFPLQQSGGGVQETDELLQKQFDVMHALLQDDVPEVRLVAVKGVGQVLALYWELIPLEVIQSLVSYLIQDLTFDITSPAVREAVIKVMFRLCDNHMCVPMLKTVLPQLKNFIHDTSHGVRLSMLELLLKVKQIRAIKFWAIVPVEHLLARLESDSKLITSRIMKLLHPSFVPLDQSPQEQIERLLALISGNARASRQFFVQLPQHIALTDCMKVMMVLCRYALGTVRQLKQDNDSSAVDSSVDDSVANSSIASRSGTPASSSAAKKSRSSTSRRSADRSKCDETGEMETTVPYEEITGVVEAMYLMFSVCEAELQAHDDISMKEGVAKKLCTTVRELMSFSENAALDTALIALAGKLPSHHLPLVSQRLVHRLQKSGSSTVVRGENCVSDRVMLKSLIEWGQASQVMEMCRDSLIQVFESCDKSTCDISNTSASRSGNSSKDKSIDSSREADTSKGKKKKKKQVGFSVEESAVVPVTTCLSWLVDMVAQDTICQDKLMKKHREGLNSVLEAMQPILGQVRQFLTDCREAEDTRETLRDTQGLGKDIMVNIMTTYLRLLAFANVKNKKDSGTVPVEALHGVLTWTEEVLLPCLHDSDVGRVGRRMAEKLVEAVLRMCHCLLLAGTPDNRLLDQIISVCARVTRPDSPYLPCLVYTTLSCLYQITQVRHSQGTTDKLQQMDPPEMQTPPDHEKLSTIASESLCRILKSATHHLVEQRDEELSRDDRARLFSTEAVAFSDVFQELTQSGSKMEEVEALHAVVLETVVADLIRDSTSCDVSEDAPLPPLCAAMLSAVKRRRTNRSLFINTVDKQLCAESTSESPPSVHRLHAFTVLISQLRNFKETEVPRSSERFVSEFVSLVEQGDMDEDAFRHMKKTLETAIISWGLEVGQS